MVEIENTSAKCVRGRAKAMGGVSEICPVREYGPIFWTKIVITFLSSLFYFSEPNIFIAKDWSFV